MIGLGTFVLVGAAGLSVINRYLLVPSLMVMLFAAVAVGGFTMLERGRMRTAWTVLAGARASCSRSSGRRCASTSRG